jgi:hypothetical protein
LNLNYQCQTEKPTGCDEETGTIDCAKISTEMTADIYFPDPKSCSTYHFCKGKTLKSVKKECRKDFAFDDVSKIKHYCRRQGPSDCKNMVCTQGGFTNYGTVPSRFYGFCSALPNKPTQFEVVLYFICPEGMVFNKTMNECVINCETEGQRLIDPANPTKYYECYRAVVGGPLLFDIQECPTGKKFEPTTNACSGDGKYIAPVPKRLEWELRDRMREDM